MPQLTTLIFSIVLLCLGATTVQAGEFGTAQEAKAMLSKAIAAVRSSKEMALAMFNSGEGGFKDRDLYVLCPKPSEFAFHEAQYDLGHAALLFAAKSWAFSVIKIDASRLECFAQGMERVWARYMPLSLNVADCARVDSRPLCQISLRPAKQFSCGVYMLRFHSSKTQRGSGSCNGEEI